MATSSVGLNARFCRVARFSSIWRTWLAPDQGGSDRRIAQHPGECQLGERLAARLGEHVEPAESRQLILGDMLGLEETRVTLGAGIRRNSGEIAIGQQSLGQWTKGDATKPFGEEHAPQALFDPALEHMIV